MGTGPSPSGNSGSTDDNDDEEQAEEEQIDDEQTTLDEQDSDNQSETGAGAAGAGSAAAGAASAAGGAAGAAGAAGAVSAGAGGVETSKEAGEGSEDTDTDCDDDSTSESSKDTEGHSESHDEGYESSEEDEVEEEKEEDLETEAEIVVQTDAWDVVGWGQEPMLKQLQEKFTNVDVTYTLLEPRSIDTERWHRAAENCEMPTTSTPQLPDSTTWSYLALQEAQRQGCFREYLRRLRIAAIVEGRDIEDREILVNLAGEIDLDLSDVEWHSAQDATVRTYGETPIWYPKIGVREPNWSDEVEYHFIEYTLIGENIRPKIIQKSLKDFVEEYQPVARPEINAIYDEIHSDGIRRVEFGGAEFWCAL